MIRHRVQEGVTGPSFPGIGEQHRDERARPGAIRPFRNLVQKAHQQLGRGPYVSEGIMGGMGNAEVGRQGLEPCVGRQVPGLEMKAGDLERPSHA